MKFWSGRTEDIACPDQQYRQPSTPAELLQQKDSKSMACHVNRCYYYQHGSHYPRQSQIVTCCYISHKATDMFERNEQPGSAQRPGRPTDRQTNRSHNNIHFSAWISYQAFNALQLQKTWLHLTPNIFRSLSFYAGYQNKSQEYLSSFPLHLCTAQPRRPLTALCILHQLHVKNARLFRPCSLQISLGWNCQLHPSLQAIIRMRAELTCLFNFYFTVTNTRHFSTTFLRTNKIIQFNHVCHPSVAQTHKGKDSILSHRSLRVISWNLLSYMFRLTYITAIIRIRTENYTRVTPYLVLLLFAVRPQVEYRKICAWHVTSRNYWVQEKWVQ